MKNSLLMDEYTPLLRFWTGLKMKNWIGVQKMGLEYFDNRNRLIRQFGYLGKDPSRP